MKPAKLKWPALLLTRAGMSFTFIEILDKNLSSTQSKKALQMLTVFTKDFPKTQQKTKGQGCAARGLNGFWSTSGPCSRPGPYRGSS